MSEHFTFPLKNTSLLWVVPQISKPCEKGQWARFLGTLVYESMRHQENSVPILSYKLILKINFEMKITDVIFVCLFFQCLNKLSRESRFF